MISRVSTARGDIESLFVQYYAEKLDRELIFVLIVVLYQNICFSLVSQGDLQALAKFFRDFLKPIGPIVHTLKESNSSVNLKDGD